MRQFFFFLFAISFGLASYGQSQNSKKLFTIDSVDIGGYIGFNTKLTTINSLGAGIVDLQFAVVINHKWVVGYNTSGLVNDRHLNKLVTDADYHLMGGYQGIFIERMYKPAEDFRFAVSFLVGQGNVKYMYCRSVIADKKWYEEIIDQAEFYIIQPSLEINYNLIDDFWIGLNAGINLTTAIRMMDTDRALLNKCNGGLTIKYGVL